MTPSEKRDLRDRNRRAEALGEGQWYDTRTGIWHAVEVSFYPKTKLWLLDESGARSEITRAELDANYKQLEL